MLPTPTNPANSPGIGEYPFNPQWFLKLPVANTLNGQESIWGWQNGALVQFPINLIPQLEAVTSVGLALPGSVFSVSNSPVTTTGTLTGTFVNQAQNSVFAGPSSGGAGTPGFRALVSADLPTIGVAQGGTGRTSITAHAVVVGEGTSAVGQIGPGTTGQMLLGVTGADPAFGNNPTIVGGTIDNSVIGGTTPAAGSFTNLSASGTVSGTGFSNYLASPPAIGGTTPAAGSFTNLSATGTFTPSQTNGIVGTTTNNNANAGSIGEYVTAGVAQGSPVSTPTSTNTNVVSISLTAGDWDVEGTTGFVVSASASALLAWINTVSATQPTMSNGFGYSVFSQSSATLGNQQIPIMRTRLSLSATTTVYMSCQAIFPSGTVGAWGVIRARRVR